MSTNRDCTFYVQLSVFWEYMSQLLVLGTTSHKKEIKLTKKHTITDFVLYRSTLIFVFFERKNNKSIDMRNVTCVTR